MRQLKGKRTRRSLARGARDWEKHAEMTANSSAHNWVRGSPWLGRDLWLLQWGGKGSAERESWSQVAPRYRHRVRMELQSDRVWLQSVRVGL